MNFLLTCSPETFVELVDQAAAGNQERYEIKPHENMSYEEAEAIEAQIEEEIEAFNKQYSRSFDTLLSDASQRVAQQPQDPQASKEPKNDKEPTHT